jgi:glycerol-3-phosphate acyltransferase PlsX
MRLLIDLDWIDAAIASLVLIAADGFFETADDLLDAFFESKIDVVVCDGFTGNVVLKSCEATAGILMKWMKEELTKNPIRMAGAWLARNAFRTLKKRGSYENYGGSPLLGTNGITVIAHGSSSPLAMMNAIRVAAEAIEHGVNPHIEEEIAKVSTVEKPRVEPVHV